MNCAECKELMVGFLEGLLDESEKIKVSEHLNACSSCKAEFTKFGKMQERLVSNGKVFSTSDFEENVFNRIVREQKTKLKQAGFTSRIIDFRRIIMKSPISKLAAAAAIIIVSVFGINQFFGGTVTFAEVIKPILNARTVVLDLIIGNEETDPLMHEIVVGSRIRRTMSNMPNMTMVIDLDSANMLVLDSVAKTASYVDIHGELRERTQSYVNFLRDIIMKLKDNPDIEKLGEQIIDGHKAVGFTCRGPNEEVTIWADAKTALPIRVYLRIGQMSAILKNFKLDVPIDDSLISMDVPPGYTKKETQFELGNATEQDFVESLRIWAGVLGDGTFPDAIGTENAMKEVPMLGQKIGKLNLPEEQATQMGMAFGKGMLFLQSVNDSGGEWHYVGKGVKLGDSSKAIFWYKPKDSQTWRIIYGDLSVQEVAPEDLPK